MVLKLMVSNGISILHQLVRRISEPSTLAAAVFPSWRKLPEKNHRAVAQAERKVKSIRDRAPRLEMMMMMMMMMMMKMKMNMDVEVGVI